MIPMWATEILAAAAALMMLGLLAQALWPAVRDALKRWRALSSGFEKAFLLFAVAAMVMYGGSKSIMSRTSHDPEIGLVAAEYAQGGSVTNLVPETLMDDFGHGTNMAAYAFSVTNAVFTPSELAQKVWWREDNRDAWTNFANTAALPSGLDMQAGWTINGPTTTVYYVFGPTNSWGHQQIYVGDDLPPVYIETEGGITLDSLVMTSRKVTIAYTVDAAALTGPGQVVFERMASGGNWAAVRTVEASAGTHVEKFFGFFVKVRTMWRIRLQVEVSE